MPILRSVNQTPTILINLWSGEIRRQANNRAILPNFICFLRSHRHRMLTKDVLLTKTLSRTLKILSNFRINLTCFHKTRCSSRWDWTRQIKIKRANKQILAISNPKSSSTPPPPTLISISFNKVNNYKNSRSSKLPSKIWWTTPSSSNTCSSKTKPFSRVPLTHNKAQAK